jgi:hypothetical protein
MNQPLEVTFTNANLAHILGDDDMPGETLRCGSCSQPVPQLFACTWDPELEVGPCCMPEPDCSCQMDGGDLFDPRGCEVHDANSPWNRRLRAVTSVQQWERQVA